MEVEPLNGNSLLATFSTETKSLEGADFIDENNRGEEEVKTSLRLRYEAEVRVIARKLGGLEDIRAQLGVSRRKMAQLLMVDPSAWTRWSKQPEKIPPHIYRALQWYLALIDKKPEWHPQNSYMQLETTRQKEELEEIKARLLKKMAEFRTTEELIKSDMQRTVVETRGELEKFENSLERQGGVHLAWKFLLLLNTGLLIYYIFVR